MNFADVPGGANITLANGTALMASSAQSSDGPYTMLITILIGAGDTAEIDIADGGSGSEDDRRVTFETVRMGSGSTLTWDQNREGASRINFLLDGDVNVNVDTNHDSDHSAYAGNIETSVATTTFTLDHVRSSNNKGTVLFVGELNVNGDEAVGSLNLDADVNIGEPADDKAKRVQLSSDASYRWNLDTTGDVVNVTRDLTISDGFSFIPNALDSAVSGVYDLFTFTGTLTADLDLLESNANDPEGMINVLDIYEDSGTVKASVEVIRPRGSVFAVE